MRGRGTWWERGQNWPLSPEAQPDSCEMEQRIGTQNCRVPFPQVAEILQALPVRPSCPLSRHERSPSGRPGPNMGRE